MGIELEFETELALRPYGTGEINTNEFLPKLLKKKGVHKFLKPEQRNYWLKGEMPLKEIGEEQQLSGPLASIIIIESTHFLHHGEVYMSKMLFVYAVCFNMQKAKCKDKLKAL